MDYSHFLSEALEIVSAWEISEEDFFQAAIDQAKLMAGMHLELSCDLPTYSPYATLRF